LHLITTTTTSTSIVVLLSSLLKFLVLAPGCGDAQCEGCQEYCCTGRPPFCCSYYAYAGDVLSGTAISGIVFGVVFLMGAVAALSLCLCVCMKDGRGSRVGVFNSSYISTVSQGYPGPPPPYTSEYEMYSPSFNPPPYTPTQPRPVHYSPPPPYPGSKNGDNQDQVYNMAD
uniref:Cysteine and tyrosine-rich protein 1 n=1 Tax=Periophthalmus magnuspinnatus TaxID=409849 RepID=A0A3B3ZBH8_9GOBI